MSGDRVEGEVERRSPVHFSADSSTTTSRRRSPEGASANGLADNTDGRTTVVDMGGNDTPTRVSPANRDRNLASLMAQFLPSIATSPGSSASQGASDVVSRALNNLASSTTSSQAAGRRVRRARRSRGPLQLRSIFREWRSSNSDLSTESDSDEGAPAFRRQRSRRSAVRHHTSRSESNQSQDNSSTIVDLTSHLTSETSPGTVDRVPNPDSSIGGANDAANDAGEDGGGSARSVVQALAPLMNHGVPFLLLVLLKLLWQHSLGLLVLLAVNLTFWHVNKILKNQVALKERRSLAVLAWIIIFLSSDIYLLFLVFQDQDLENSFLFREPKIMGTTFGLWDLLWVVGITDFVIRFGAITCKAVVVLVPRTFIPYKFRGKYYLLVETLSMFYRNLTPTRPWVCYLWGGEIDNKIVSGLLVAIYSLLKLNSTRKVLVECFSACKSFRRHTSYGNVPSKAALAAMNVASGGDETGGGGCPICQEDFQEPVELSCKHIFCEECVSMWFDRERTCPLCRATIADDPKWRDGATSQLPQLY